MKNRPKVIVTGGAGYIGSHTVVDLQRAGYQVVIIDDLSNARPEVLDGIQAISGERPDFYKINICHTADLNDVLAAHIDAVGVIHFAAFKAVGESVAEPLKYYANNIGGLTTLLQAMKMHGLDNLIFSSSCTVYGQPEQLPVTEDTPFQIAHSPYGNTKQIAEEILQDACKAGLFEGVIALRYFNPVGADASALIGELPIGVPNNLMPFITQTAIGIRTALQVFGNDYSTPDGTAIRDYIHVADLATAHRLAMERLIQKKQSHPFEVFNIGTGRGYSVLEVIQTFEKVTGKALPYHFTDRRPGDVESVYADTTKAEKVLGWKSTRNLEMMTASAWEWEKQLAKKG
jgi:UDP-glucose 4-epimerase